MKILSADDHALFRAGMRYVLAQLADDVSIIEAGAGAEALKSVDAQEDIALVLLDLDMPGCDGFAVLQTFSRQYPALPVVVLSASENRADMRHALDTGAVGYIPKSSTPQVMLSALRLVSAGGVYVPPAMVFSSRDQMTAPTTLEPGVPLTTRQSEVLRCVFEGKPNKIIAAELDLSEATVKAHITAVFRVLNVSNRTQAARAAQRLGLTIPVKKTLA